MGSPQHERAKKELANRLGGGLECPIGKRTLDACGPGGVGEVELSGKYERILVDIMKLCSSNTKGERILQVPKSDASKAKKIARLCPHNIKVEALEKRKDEDK